MKKINKKLKNAKKKIVRRVSKSKKLDVKRDLTLRQICKIMNIRVPKRFKKIQDISREVITLRKGDLKPGSIFFGGFEEIVDVDSFYKELVDKGADVIFMDEENYKKFPPNNEYPVIMLKNYMQKQGKFFNYIKESFGVPTIAITGSVGKTTTTQLMNNIFSKKYKLFEYKGNWNTCASIANHIMNGLSSKNNMYIQECGAGQPLSIEKSAIMLKPDAYILTNVLPHHLNHYKTIENIFNDKTSFSKYLKKGGVLVTNFDDERIANYKFPHKVISVGIKTEKDVDYRAVNIVQNREYLEFDIIYGSEICHVKMNIMGKHNAYNVLCAFAMAKHYGIDEETIKEGILDFRTTGIRQNVRNICGVTFYLDCYNVCNENIKASVRALEEMQIGAGGKKIALLGGENKLGEDYYDITYSVGKELSNSTLDRIICYSLADESQKQIDYYGESKPMYQALIDNGYKNCELITNRDDLVKRMKELLKPGDACLIKGNFELDMTMAVDEIYGTSITMDNETIYERNKIVEEGSFKMKVNDDFKKGTITECVEDNITKLIIPDTIDGYKVFRTKKRLFREKNIEEIDFGNSIENIGIASFSRNNSLKKLNIPKNVKWISSNAFSLCKNLEKVICEEGLLNISKHAFYGCDNLKEITLPNSILFIDDLAFEKVPNLTVKCHKNSYVYDYCINNNINVKIIK